MSILKMLRKQQETIFNTITTSLVCRVISYNESTCTAKLEPMYKDANGEKMSVLDNVPVLKHRFRVEDSDIVREYIPILRAGEKVLVTYSKYALDDVLNGNIATVSDNIFRDIDAIVVGVLP